MPRNSAARGRLLTAPVKAARGAVLQDPWAGSSPSPVGHLLQLAGTSWKDAFAEQGWSLKKTTQQEASTHLQKGRAMSSATETKRSLCHQIQKGPARSRGAQRWPDRGKRWLFAGKGPANRMPDSLVCTRRKVTVFTIQVRWSVRTDLSLGLAQTSDTGNTASSPSRHQQLPVLNIYHLTPQEALPMQEGASGLLSSCRKRSDGLHVTRQSRYQGEQGLILQMHTARCSFPPYLSFSSVKWGQQSFLCCKDKFEEVSVLLTHCANRQLDRQVEG